MAKTLLEDNIKQLGETGVVKPSTLDRTNVLFQVYDEVLKGKTMNQILTNIQNGKYGYPYCTEYAYDIMAEARDMLEIDFQQEKPFLKQKFFLMLQDIYAESREAKDRQNAISSIRELSKLMGLYDDSKSRQSVTVKSKDEEITISFNLYDDNEEPTEKITDAEIIEQ